MTNPPAAMPQSAAESALQPLLDAYANQKRSAQQLTSELIAICTTQPAATWEALSLLDRYHRRGVLSTALFREIKKDLNSVAFGSGRSALSAPGPEADRTSGFMSIFGAKRARSATSTHALRDRTEAMPRTVGIQAHSRTAHLHATQQHTEQSRTAHLQRSSERTEHIKTEYLDDAPHTERLGASREIDTAYYSNTELQHGLEQGAPANRDRTERIQSSPRDTAVAADRTERIQTLGERTAHMATSVNVASPQTTYDKTERIQRDHTIRLQSEPSAAPRGPEPRTQWVDGRPETDQESDTEYFSSTELRQSHSAARPTGTVVHDLREPPRDQTLPRDQRTKFNDVPSSYAEEDEHTVMEREALTQATLAQSPSLRPGTVLMDRYVLVEPISNGGIGVIFKALDRQRDSLPESQRYVAIKCLHESLQNDARAIAALRHEFRQSQALSHPNIARIYDCHQADGITFLSMELIEGETLSRICERIAPRRLPPSRALTIVREIGHAIAHAHEQGILHGNLNPSNVVVTRSGLVRVHEFGQATAWQESAAGFDGAVRDIPPSPPEQRYRSPQQKSAVPADAADDIYSLACIAFELLCGRAPDASAHKAGENKPNYARHLNQQRWRALQIGLAEDRSIRGNDVRHWLAALDLSSAAIRLPSLSDLETELFGGEQSAWSKPWIGASLAASVVAVAVGVWLWQREPQAVRTERMAESAVATQSNEQDDRLSGAQIEQRDNAPQASSIDGSSGAQGSISTLPSDVVQPSEQSSEQPFGQAASLPRNDSMTSSSATAGSSGLPSVSFGQDRYEIAADAPVATLTVRRDGATDKRLSLQWFSMEGSAKSDVDYVRDGNTTIVMQPGQRTASIVIPLIGGAQRDRAVWFDVRIRATTEALPGKSVVATVYLMPAMAQTLSP